MKKYGGIKMRIVKPSFEILNGVDLDFIVAAGKTCYKSEKTWTDEERNTFIKNLIIRGHESVLEHQSVSVRMICDRGVSHEIVRHRLASYSQESTRYCCYKNHISFIKPCFLPKLPDGIIDDATPEDFNLTSGDFEENERLWIMSMLYSEKYYHRLLALGHSAQEARSVLPNSLKTEIVMTANLREWRHFFKLRTAKAAHPQMREITIPMLKEFQELIPIVFDDITNNK
jgi:thymidylate synthase (FAD)